MVLVPYANTKAEATVAAVRYPVKGIRDVGGSPRAQGYGLFNQDYFPYADQEVMLFERLVE